MNHRHHRKRRSQGGDDSYGNIIEIPSEIHELVHAHVEKAYEHGLLVHSYDNPSEIRPDVSGFLSELGVEMPEPRKRKNFDKDSEERRKRTRISIAVPKDRENGGEVWDEIVAMVKAKLVRMGLYEADAQIPNYEALVAALYHFAVLSDG